MDLAYMRPIVHPVLCHQALYDTVQDHLFRSAQKSWIYSKPDTAIAIADAA